ncbi:hypothetical protein I79_016232 [Cricetulus griseus]|uniref:Uncharacterized protein n=1 Tax=Cricetulus griseus TaxID=10029 RepID=G3HYU0_CRIGR|nr:hypothetical protein I79_016232 [Cricetulus griseus]
MLRRKGRLSSTQATSEENRFKTRPEGVESKKVTGAWKREVVGQGQGLKNKSWWTGW